MPPRKIPDPARFRELFSDPKLLIKEIASELGVHPCTVAREAKRLGLPPIKRHLQRITTKPSTEQDWDTFRLLFRSCTFDELARLYCVSIRTVKYWAKEAGLRRWSNPPPREEEGEIEGTYEQLMDLVKRSARLILQETWTPPELNVQIEDERPIAITFTADWHLGAPGVDYDAFDRMRNLIIQTDGLYAYIGGDGTERFIKAPSVPRGAGIEQQPITIQRLLFIRALEGMIGKVVAFGTGNHELWMKVATGYDDLAEIARQLKFVYTGPGGLLNLTVGKQIYRIFRSHKFRFSSALNLTHAAKQCWRLGAYDADIIVIEHRHEAAIETFTGHGQERIAIRTGTFLVFDDYARRMGFYGAEVGNPTVILFPEERKMIAFKHLEDAVLLLESLRSKERDHSAEGSGT